MYARLEFAMGWLFMLTVDEIRSLDASCYRSLSHRRCRWEEIRGSAASWLFSSRRRRTSCWHTKRWRF
jgi:hypothetical protein